VQSLPGWKAGVNKLILDGVKLSVNGRARTVEVEAGRPLLFGLMSAGIYIPSACGGRGSCGQCRVRIDGGAPPPNDAERLLLTERDRAAGFHLSCQIRVSGSLSIQIPPKHFGARQYTARVAGAGDLTWEIREVVLEVTGARDFSFTAGQYVQVFLPGTETSSEPLYRAYSMASPPSSKHLLTFFVKREPGGVVSPYICDQLRVGDAVALRGPFGDFRMHESEREILLIAGGSGLAPIRSMLLEMVEMSSTRTATLYFSARSRRDLFDLDELRSLEHTLTGFRFIPALSNPLPHEPWDGETGGITAVLNRRLGRLDNHEAYLCGSAGMIEASIRVLQKKGLPDELLFFDKFL
jgi:Na+-transporting NADH:ubiquinone oxidoreductase subunit F